jgi:hypothetical protein
LLVILSSGFLFDIVGRRWLIFIGYFGTGLSLFIFPLGSPDLKIYIAAGVMFNLFVSIQQCAPLVMDYVIK